MRWRSTLRVMVTVVVIVASAGCAPMRDDRVDMMDSDVVGVWTSTHDRSLTFHADGRFVAVGLPHQLLEGFRDVVPPGFDPNRDSLNGSGQWLLEADRSDPDGPRNYVHLTLRQLSGSQVAVGLNLRAEWQAGEIVLVFYLGDPDLNRQIVYEKCPQPCAVASTAPTTGPS